MPYAHINLETELVSTEREWFFKAGWQAAKGQSLGLSLCAGDGNASPAFFLRRGRRRANAACRSRAVPMNPDLLPAKP
jgi:hypothetical protein